VWESAAIREPSVFGGGERCRQSQLHFPGTPAPPPLRLAPPTSCWPRPHSATQLGARPTSQRPRAARACPVRAQRPGPWERPAERWPGAEEPSGWAWGGRAPGPEPQRQGCGVGVVCGEQGYGTVASRILGGGAGRACEGRRAGEWLCEVSGRDCGGGPRREGIPAGSVSQPGRATVSLSLGAARLSLVVPVTRGERGPRFVHCCG
jgi:hypothetical protein